jgi:pyridoxine kinase
MVKEVHSAAVYVCDPVLGDHGQFYVPKELAAEYIRVLLPVADVLTPNQFEAEILSGVTIKNQSDADRACEILHSFGVKLCILKGLRFESNISPLSVFASYSPSGSPRVTCCVEVESIGTRLFVGCGDLFSSLVVGHLKTFFPHNVTQETLTNIITRVVAVMSIVLHETFLAKSEELCLIECAEEFLKVRRSLNDSNLL